MSKRATSRNGQPLLPLSQPQQQPGVTIITAQQQSPRIVTGPAAIRPGGADQVAAFTRCASAQGASFMPATVTVQTACAAAVPRQALPSQTTRMQSTQAVQAVHQPTFPPTAAPVITSARGSQGPLCATLVSRTVEHYSLQIPIAPASHSSQPQAIHAAHGQRIVHRQEQPSQIMPVSLCASQTLNNSLPQHSASQKQLTQSQQVEVQVEADTFVQNEPEAVEEIVPGLRAFFDAAKLRHYHSAADKWCKEAGAVEMLEIFEALDELSEALELKTIEKRRLRKMADHWRADHGQSPASTRDSADASSVAPSQSQSQPTNLEDAVVVEEAVVTPVQPLEPVSEGPPIASMPTDMVEELSATITASAEPVEPEKTEQDRLEELSATITQTAEPVELDRIERDVAPPRDSLASLVGELEDLELAGPRDSLASLVGGLEAIEPLGSESLDVTAESEDAVEEVLPQRFPKTSLPAIILDHQLGPRPPPSPLERPPVYGLDAELEAKAAAKYDGNAELEAACWVQAITGVRVVGDFAGVLRDGQILCDLANSIKPGSVAKVNQPGKPFRERENISHFLRACRHLGVQEYALFSTDDLYDKKNLMSVVRCIHALGGAVQRSVPEFQGPRLGVADTSHAKRDSRREMAPVTQTGGLHTSMERSHLDLISGQVVRGGC